MPGHCTCGAKLPDDARFCHKCGKPQREEDLRIEQAAAEQSAARQTAAQPQPAPVPTVHIFTPPLRQAPPIGFHNRAAVSTAFLAGILGFLLSVISGQVVPAASSLGLIAAGFLAVYLYQRRTGEHLSVLHGAHLGWISGIFGFAITAVVLGGVIAILSDPNVVNSMREQLKDSSAARQAQIDQMMKMIHNPPLLLMGIAVTFLLFTVFPAFGGALGAKFLDRRS